MHFGKGPNAGPEKSASRKSVFGRMVASILNKQRCFLVQFFSIRPLEKVDFLLDIERRKHMHNKNLKTESGRSMVEMLGVLAVIGVLTVIGFAGFKIAMNKAKANNLVADMNRLAHVVVMDKFSGYSEEAIQNAVAEHNQSTEYQAIYKTLKPGIFTLEATEIDKDLCQQVAGLDWQVPLATFVDGAEKDNFVAEDCGDSNTLTWAFTDDLSACPDCVLGEVDCSQYGDNGTLECGSCTELKGFTADNSKCANNENGDKCVRGKCTPCEEGLYFWTKYNTCYACNIDITASRATVSTTKHNCLGTMAYTKAGNMIGCNEDGNFSSDDELSCKACENRCFFNLDGYTQCRYYGGTTGLKKNPDGTCSECQKGYWRYTNGNTCVACNIDYGGTWNTVSATEHNCLKKMFACHNTKTGAVSIHGCNDDATCTGSTFFADETSCKECPNRCYLNGRCYFAGEGQAYQRVSNEDGTCQQ